MVKYDDEFQAYAELMQANKDTRLSQTLSRPCRQSKGGHEATQQDQVVAEVGSQRVAEVGSAIKEGTVSSSMVEENEHVRMEEFVTFDQVSSSGIPLMKITIWPLGHAGRTAIGILNKESMNGLSCFILNLCTQGMQTDPMMDPLGQWSNVPSVSNK